MLNTILNNLVSYFNDNHQTIFSASVDEKSFVTKALAVNKMIIYICLRVI